MNKIISLDSLKLGQRATIEYYKLENNFTYRLKDLGLVKGMAVRTYTVSPFGSPICIESKCGKLLLRKQMLKNIYVRVMQ